MGRHAQHPASRSDDSRPRPTARVRGELTVTRPSTPVGSTAGRPVRRDDGAVAMAVLPPVPGTGARAGAGPVVDGRDVGPAEGTGSRRARRVAQAQAAEADAQLAKVEARAAKAAARADAQAAKAEARAAKADVRAAELGARVVTTGERRKGGRLHGVLVYSLGLVLILSSVYGVASNVGDGDNVVTDTASSFRKLCFGDDTVEDAGQRGNRRAKAEEAPVQAAPAAEPAEEVDEEVDEAPAEEPAEPAAEQVATQAAPVAAAPAPVAAPVAAPAPAAAGTSSSVPAGTWLSGASGDGVANGAFGAWRGTPVAIGGTWADNNEAMTELWQLDKGGEFGSWNQALDIAIGAISDDESWGQAAQGAYDARWRESLTNLKTKWGNRSAPLFIRFAHEMNGNWYPWSVDAGNKEAFVASWKRFRAMQQQIFPSAKLVFSLNRESVGSGFDWRQSFPGKAYVDVIGVDYYNQYPYVASASEWTASLDDVDKYGAPKGLQQHLDFARSVGLPLSVPEWSGHATNGDSSAWIQGMHDFFAQNAGGGAGQFIYDVQFNIDMHGDAYRLYPTTRMPKSAATYKAAF